MARPTEVDRARAQRAASRLFWRRGYGATSMQQLLDATGMGSGSFYAAFGSKAGLFENIVNDYSAHSSKQFATLKKQYRGLEVIRAFLDMTLVDLSDAGRRKGCLLVNSALELEGVEPQLYQVVSANLQEFEREIRECLVEAAEQGNLRTEVDIERATGLVMTLIEGLRVGSRLGLTREDARCRVDSMLEMLSNKPKVA